MKLPHIHGRITMKNKKIPLLSTLFAFLTTTSPILIADQTSEQSIFQPTKDVLANIYIDNNQLVIETDQEKDQNSVEKAKNSTQAKDENNNKTQTDTDNKIASTSLMAITTIKDDYLMLYPNQLYILNDSDSDGMIEISALKSVNATLNEFCYSIYNYNVDTKLYENKTALISCQKGNLKQLDNINTQQNIANAGAASSSKY